MSWNARGLIHHDPVVKQSKFKVLESALMQSDILMVQEVHGIPSEALRQLRVHRRFFHIEVSNGTGDLLIFVRRTIIHVHAMLESNSTVTTINNAKAT